MWITRDDDRYLTLRELAEYAGLSIRTLQRFMSDPEDPLPVVRVLERTIRVRKSDFDRWAQGREARWKSAPGAARGLSEAQRIKRELLGFPVEK